MNPRFPGAIVLAALALAFSSCDGGSPTQPPPTPPTTVAPEPSPSPVPSASPGSASCPFAPGPVVRLALFPRELTTDGVSAPMRVRVVSGSEEQLCLDKDKSHRIDFNLNQKNAAGLECCWEDEGPTYRVRQDVANMVVDYGAVDTNAFVLRMRVEPRGQESGFGVEGRLDGIISHPWESGGRYPREPLRVVTLPGDEIPALCPCIYFSGGRYEGGACVR
jgi:hypothetical protein